MEIMIMVSCAIAFAAHFSTMTFSTEWAIGTCRVQPTSLTDSGKLQSGHAASKLPDTGRFEAYAPRVTTATPGVIVVGDRNGSSLQIVRSGPKEMGVGISVHELLDKRAAFTRPEHLDNHGLKIEWFPGVADNSANMKREKPRETDISDGKINAAPRSVVPVPRYTQPTHLLAVGRPGRKHSRHCAEQRYDGYRDAHDRGYQKSVAIFRRLGIILWLIVTVGVLIGHAVLCRSRRIWIAAVVASCGIAGWSVYWSFNGY